MLALALALIVGAYNSYPADLTWTNKSSGVWQSRTAWITNGTGGTGGYPGATDAAWFTNAATYSVTLTNNVTILSNFFSNASSTIATVTLTVGANSLSEVGTGTHPGAFVLGDTANSTTIVYLATSSVAGKGLFVTNSTSGRICVGNNGVGTLLVTNGYVLTSRTILANGDTGRGTLVLSGASTVWSNTGSLTIGNTATATGSSMVISNSASMTVMDTFGVGVSGSGNHSLLLDTGGRLFTGNAGTVSVGSGAGTNNSAIVQNGARWDNGGAVLSVGGTGTGNSLTIGTTATVTSVSTLNITAGNSLNLSGGVVSVSAAVTNTSGTIKGFGTIVGNTVFTGTGTLTPGYGNSIGTLTFSNAMTLISTSTTLMTLDKSQSSNDLVNVVGALTYGGTLTVTNVGAALTNGDTFNLFDFGSQSGSFSTTNLPTLSAGLKWDTSQLNPQGIIAVAPPLASFTGTPTNGTAPLAVTFTDASSGIITNRFWNFGDGSTTNFAVLTNPTHTYTAGTYTVSLTVSSQGGSTTNTRSSYIVALTPGSIAVSPASYAFSALTTGTTAQTTFVVTNSGGTAVSNGTASVSGPYSILVGATFSVAGFATTNVTVQFAPVSIGAFTNNVIFATANGGAATNTVTGTGLTPARSASVRPATGSAPSLPARRRRPRSWSPIPGARRSATARSA